MINKEWEQFAASDFELEAKKKINELIDFVSILYDNTNSLANSLQGEKDFSCACGGSKRNGLHGKTMCYSQDFPVPPQEKECLDCSSEHSYREGCLNYHKELPCSTPPQIDVEALGEELFGLGYDYSSSKLGSSRESEQRKRKEEILETLKALTHKV